MDVLDRRIIGHLARHGRASLQDLAAAVQLGPSATRDRLRRLERDGTVSGYTVVLDEGRLGFPISGVLDVDLAPGTDPLTFEAALRDLPAVVEAMHATGGSDYVVRVSCADTAELHALVRALKSRHGASGTTTRVVLEQTVPRRPRLP